MSTKRKANLPRKPGPFKGDGIMLKYDPGNDHWFGAIDIHNANSIQLDDIPALIKWLNRVLDHDFKVRCAVEDQ